MKWFRIQLVLLALAAGYARAEDAEAPVEASAATPAAGFGRAFGRIEYVEGGKVVAMSSGFLESTNLTLFVRSLRTGTVRYMEIVGDGSFAWPLEAGEYVVVGYQFLRVKGTAKSSRNARMMAAFSVPQPGQAAYIGDLRIDRSYRAVDAYDQAVSLAQAKLAGFEPVKSILRFEPPAGKYSAVVGVCNERWRLACSETFRGVEPVQPFDPSQSLPGLLRSVPVTQSLAPVLEWKPAGAGLTYDVVVYESLSISINGPVSHGKVEPVRGMRGTQVAYAEGLAEPRYAFTAPLGPGKRYEWSVRLRDGDIVSSWSTTSHSTFLLVAASSGSGQGFVFETPKQ